MSKPTVQPINRERPFEINELFFSTTDRYSVIKSGNEVFARVAGYASPAELIGKPHNVIRHPDMPRSVFKLMWDMILAGQPIATYVKNLATDGAYYWVMALVVPTQTGFLSLRFKPSSPIFTTIANLYRELLAVEATSDPGRRQQSMDAASAVLQQKIRALGYADYEEFMHFAMAQEMAEREKQILTLGISRSRGHVGALHGTLAHRANTYETAKRHLDSLFNRVAQFLSHVEDLRTKSSYLRNLSHAVHLLSLNAIISSHHLEHEGRGLAVVTHNLADVSSSSSEIISEMTESISGLVRAMRNTAFAITSAKLQIEMAIDFMSEIIRKNGPDTPLNELQMADLKDIVEIETAFTGSLNMLVGSLPGIKMPLRGLNDRIRTLSDALRMLSCVHTFGRIEVAHVSDGAHFLVLFQEFHEQLEVATQEIRGFDRSVALVSQFIPDFEKTANAIDKSVISVAA